MQRLVAADAKGRSRGVLHAVPTAVRAYGVAPNLAADDAQYVLGWADEDRKPERVAQCHAAFVELTRRWAESPQGRDDPVAQAVSTFLRSGAAVEMRRPGECTAKSGVLIAVAGVPAYRAASVPDFWSHEVARRKGAGNGLCLACGRVGPLLDTVPGKVPSRLVPGATNDTALVSVNERVFGYDLVTQLSASPVCIRCGEAVTTGLIRVLGSTNSSSFGGQDSRLAWWTTQDTPFDAMALLHRPSGPDVAALLGSVHTARQQAATELGKARFCSVTLGGNVARIMVRDWVEMPLEQLQRHVAEWFADQRMVSTRPDGAEFHSIGQFALIAGRWITDGKRGRYADFGAKGANRPADVHRDLVRAALRKTPVPPSLLAHLVHRVRTDGHLDDARAALIRLILTRSPLTTEKPMPGLDPSNTNPAYVAGRAFAVLDQIQYSASEERRNTTYGDRFFAGAISNPRAALVTGRRDAAAWLRKLRRTKTGAAIRHEKELDGLFALLDPARDVPARTTLTEQSLFLLGYHHQRAHGFAAARAARDTVTETPEETNQ
ncbi:type I-C CRISPR-associated protein Cas8c/Csd1 [Pseudonocardia asaccharolytica]|uniref:CRISPR-associated Csd1 family protein n=1 Tax=Pseudonocardia asaccharolytica DSM 44247 = NBRC 16224 TaxID=1123024 RepID=A0A511D8P5_9PSEU|nr:type I-C CRISPR-associated protein Cas8c/Csd1 [Pseudonocardia asaccharolytica]GEL20977.1 CRISPR-associated Csd1 family protein [Pseudonocardia asaccharolytica DSM 44247 = NBRC 16224]